MIEGCARWIIIVCIAVHGKAARRRMIARAGAPILLLLQLLLRLHGQHQICTTTPLCSSVRDVPKVPGSKPRSAACKSAQYSWGIILLIILYMHIPLYYFFWRLRLHLEVSLNAYLCLVFWGLRLHFVVPLSSFSPPNWHANGMIIVNYD